MAAMLQYFGAIGCPDGVPGVVPATYNGRDNNGKPFLTIGGEYDWSILADKTKLSDYSSLTTDQRLYMIMVILGILGWPGFAYITRAQVLVARESEYVTAAQATGVKPSRIAFKHILPNIVSVILVNMTLSFAASMQTETSLSFLGFGVNYPQPSWGNMLSRASNAVAAINFWWQWVFTSAILILTTVCINTIGDTLRDVMDPKSTNDK